MWNLLTRRRTVVPTTPAATDRLGPNRDVLSAEQDGLIVLLDLRREVYLGLDEVGTVIWRGIERGATCAEIRHDLSFEFDAPIDVLCDDADRFITDLLHRQLVVRV